MSKVLNLDGDILYEFSGSAVIDSLNDFGESDFIGDNASLMFGDEIEFIGNPKYAENGQAVDYVAFHAEYYEDKGQLKTENYQYAARQLAKTPLQYNKILSATKNVALINELISVGVEVNRRVYIDIDGNMTPDGAIAFKKQFNYKAQEGMYTSWIYAPIVRTDVTGQTGVYVYGTSGMRAGYSAAHLMNLNALGLPPIQQPIAGKNFMLSGTRLRMTHDFTDTELADLAENHIIPVMYQEYDDGAGYVWVDSLSGAKKSGISKLESASDISIWAQERWGRFSKGLEQMPMDEAIRKAKLYTQTTLRQMQTSGWLVESAALGGAAFAYEIMPNQRYPDDRLEIILHLSVNGVVRRVTVSQNLYNRN